MARVKLNIAKQPVATLLQTANNINTALTENANFPTPDPSLKDLIAAITELTDASNTHQTTAALAREQLAVRDAAADKLSGILTALGAHVQGVSRGNPAIILSSGMGVRGRRTPPSLPAQVENLSIVAGDDSGELLLQWNSQGDGAWTYEVQLSPDPMTSTSWVNYPSVTKSKATVKNLASGVRMWARVRAVNPAGQGAWSDVATKMTP